MNPREAVLSVALGMLAAPLAVHAQQTGKVPRIGFLGATSESDHRVEAFRQGLRELGYTEGQNVIVEARFAEGRPARFPELGARDSIGL